MRSIIKAMVIQDEVIDSATSSSVDGIFVNVSYCFTACMEEHLEWFGLTWKDLEPLRNGTHVKFAQLEGA